MNHPYQVLGPSIPKMLGRQRLVTQLERHLLKPSPDHVQLVGPTLYGKSVLLNHLANKHQSGSSHYLTTAYDDLRHAAPTTDGEFRQRLAALVKTALSSLRPSVAEYLDPNDTSLHELLDLAFQELEQDGVRLLVILDGFDHVLAGTGLTRNLWDQLVSLARKPSFRLVTGSRRPLRELCKSEESRTSDFWEIFFDTPVFIGPFSESDWDDLTAPFRDNGVTIDGAARKELINWSGGVPVLAAATLERLAEPAQAGHTLSKSEVDAVAETILEARRSLLDALWDECGVELRSDIAALAARESEGILLSELSDVRQRALEGRGFGAASGNRIRSSCRLMARYATQQAPAVADLNRLFGTQEGFGSNVRTLLELRLAQISNNSTDAQLRNYVMHAIRDMDADPEIVLISVRSIAQRALRLIWDAEVGASRQFPEDWVQEWQHGGASPEWLTADRRVPGGDGPQMFALKLMTGTKYRGNQIVRKARFVTKPTFLLLDHLQSVGDFGQHRGDYPESTSSIGFAVAVILSALALIESLARDLAGSA